MQIVIDISEEDYEFLKRHNKHGIYSDILNGTPLPKGHGRIGDLDIILNKAVKHRKSYMEAEIGDSSYCRGKLHAYELYVEEVENAPTIIKADKAESEEV